jgi:hypothetical protein
MKTFLLCLVLLAMGLVNGCKKDSPTAPVDVTFTAQEYGGPGASTFLLTPSQASGTIALSAITATVSGTLVPLNPTQLQGAPCSYNSPFEVWLDLGRDSIGTKINFTVTGNVGSTSGTAFTATTSCVYY